MRLLKVVLSATAATLALAGPAHAGIWTTVPSGTTQDIAALDYRGPGDILIATSGGQIVRNGTVQLNAPGVQFTDIALNAAGDRGLASAANGKLYRFDGISWSVVSLANTTFGHTCGGTGPFARNATPTGNLNALTYAAADTAYVVGADRGVVLKVDGRGPFTVSDVSRQTDGSCRADAQSDTLTSIQAVTDQLIYMTSTDFGERLITADAFTSSTLRRANSSVNCPGVPSRIGIDLDNASRSWVVGACSGSLAFGFSSDSGDTYDLSLVYGNGSGSDLSGMRDVSVAGGSAVAVGNAGAILVSLDGRNAYFQRADGTEATTDWLAVDKRTATDAAVGGRSGKLVVSTQAQSIPDLVAPAGTVTGPDTATTGVPTGFTANVADNAGGSGIDLAGFSWAATGVPPATGNPVQLTFPSAGNFTVTVTFKDLAGNTATATKSVTVTDPKPVVPTKSISYSGGTIKLSIPGSCVKPGTVLKATLSFKRKIKKGNRFVSVTKVLFRIDSNAVNTDKKAPFKQTLQVGGLTPGTTHTLSAKATIKVKKLKKGQRSPSKTIKTTFRVCS